MKIRICKENRDKLQAALNAVQGSSRERTITVDDIIYSTKDIEEELKIPKRAMNNLKVHADQCAQSFPRAYKYTPMSTQYDMERTSSGWFLTNVERGACGKKQYKLTLTVTARTALLDRFTQF